MELTPPVGIYFMTVAFTPLLRKSSDPSVIVISSLSGLTNQRCVLQFRGKGSMYIYG
jgi:NAD(P)-dependent dehydrogenase (short-subunit alcohol dehydrogenase family)